MDFLKELPEQIFRDILLRVPYKSQWKIKKFLKPAKELMECFQYYQDRIKFGLSKKFICLLHPTGITLYDPVNQSSKRLPRTPTGFEISYISRIICLNHKIVLLGLKHTDVYTAKILIYDLLSCKWKQGAEIPTDRSDNKFAFCASPEGSIYIAGGFSKYGRRRRLREAAIYKVDEDKWELLPEMNQGIDRCMGVFIEGMFYVIGNMCCNKCERFDPETGEWTTIQVCLHQCINKFCMLLDN
ncbi:hypothetical protein SUGI_0688220 [Cryptomeria japonica]|nr:hypothetical protein SUGI_0688220 [Cryptomeria japonica]